MILSFSPSGHTEIVDSEQFARDPIVEASNLTITFDGSDALHDVSFAIHAGTSIALVGANGSGKSTLLNAIAGLLETTSGSLIVRTKTTPAYVLQHQHSDRWLPLTAAEIIGMGTYARRGLLGRLNASDKQAITEAAAELAVEDLLDRQFSELSGGQQQRVLVAQALAQQSEVLLLDEPITGLDIPSQKRILRLIDGASETGRTILVSTHHLDEAHHCDLVMLLANHCVAFGPPEEVLTEDNLRGAFGQRVLGDHADHDHPTGLLVLDDHGHDH